MSARKFLILAVLIFLILPSCLVYSQSNRTESITITTYYPAPYGVYRNLKLSPSNAPLTGLSEGVMYYNRTEHKLKIWSCIDQPGCTSFGFINVTESSNTGAPLVNSAHSEGDCISAGGQPFASDTSLKLCQFSNPGGVTCPAGWTRYKDFTTTAASSVATTYTYTFCPKSCTAPGHSWSNQPPACCKVRQCYIPQQCYSGCEGASTYTGCPISCWSFMSSACQDPVAIATVTQIGCY
jgi:hypothetical protein